MGVIKMFSSSSYEKSKIVEVEKVIYKNSTPNPKEFVILNTVSCNTKHLAVRIMYPSVSNYEGVKILVYKNLTKKDFLTFKSIDPHFCNNKNFKSPYVRFEPTEQGWVDAVALLKLI